MKSEEQPRDKQSPRLIVSFVERTNQWNTRLDLERVLRLEQARPA